MEVLSIPIGEFYENYASNISEDAYTNFERPLDKTRAFLIASYGSIFLIGAIGNGWVACVITRIMTKSHMNDTLRSVEIFILALCCCDLFVLSFAILLIADL